MTTTTTRTAPPADRLTGPEKALASHGVDDAPETLAACAELAPLVVATLSEQPGVPWPVRRSTGPLAVVERLDRARTLDLGGVPVRRIDPADGAPRGTYLHVHGGGWCLGSHEAQDARLALLADAAGVRVLSVGYRLAPEHPFPAALDDVLAVVAALPPGTGPLVVGGESAGAHLAALALLALRDAGRTAPDGVRGAVLSYGAYDLGGSPSRRGSDFGRHTIDQFLAGVPDERRRDPRYSPLFADLAGMPPVRILVGTRDPLVDDSLQLAARWRLAAPVELEVVPGACHGFTLLDLAVSRRAREAEHAFVRRTMRP